MWRRLVAPPAPAPAPGPNPRRARALPTRAPLTQPPPAPLAGTGAAAPLLQHQRHHELSFKRSLTQEDFSGPPGRTVSGRSAEPAAATLQAEAESAEQAEQAEVDPELRRTSKTARAAAAPARPAGGVGSTLQGQLQGQLQDVGVKIFLHCSLCCLLFTALLLADAAFVSFVFVTLQLRLEASLAVAVAFNVGLALLVALGMCLKSYAGSSSRAAAAAAAASRRGTADLEGRGAGSPDGGGAPAFDGPLGQLLQPVARMVTFIKRELRGGAPAGPGAGAAAGAPDGLLAGKLRSLWHTVGRVAGFDQHPLQLYTAGADGGAAGGGAVSGAASPLLESGPRGAARGGSRELPEAQAPLPPHLGAEVRRAGAASSAGAGQLGSSERLREAYPD
jgi:hypothetical protein